MTISIVYASFLLALGMLTASSPLSTAPHVNLKRSDIPQYGFLCSPSLNLPTVSAARELAAYFVSVTKQECVCSVARVADRRHPKTTLAIIKGVEANIWLTEANPQIVSAGYNCSRIADAIYQLIAACENFNTNGQVGGQVVLSNCIANQNEVLWDDMPSNPPVNDGGAALEIKLAGIPLT